MTHASHAAVVMMGLFHPEGCDICDGDVRLARCDLDWEDCKDPLPLPVGIEAQIHVQHVQFRMMQLNVIDFSDFS